MKNNQVYISLKIKDINGREKEWAKSWEFVGGTVMFDDKSSDIKFSQNDTDIRNESNDKFMLKVLSTTPINTVQKLLGKKSRMIQTLNLLEEE